MFGPEQQGTRQAAETEQLLHKHFSQVLNLYSPPYFVLFNLFI